MNWSDVIAPPPPRTLRQFGVLCLVIFGGLAAWRAWSGQVDGWTWGIATFALFMGGVGAIAPAVLRPVYQGWMIVAFPIGWTVSKVILAGMLYLLFTPVALVFRLMGRDLLMLRRRQAESYWTSKPAVRSGREYLRQY